MSQSEFKKELPNGIGLAPWLRMKQEGMTDNESRVVDWLLQPGNLSGAPAIKDVAETLMVSEAMIVKVAKLLGFSGFRNLRAALVDYFSQSEQVLPAELAFDEAPQDVVNKVFNICTVWGVLTLFVPTSSISFYASACAASRIRTRTL